MKKRWSKEENSLLIKLNKKGLKYSTISNLLPDRSLIACQLEGQKLGLKSNNNVNKTFFEQNTPEMHYILGYWLADGCIMNKTGGYYFSIVSKDKSHLEIIAKIMSIKNKIYNNSNETYELRIGNKILVKSLISIGGQYRKTKTISFYDIIYNKVYFYDLLRGYFDGDGSIIKSNFIKKNGKQSISGIKFTGAKKIIESLRDILKFGIIYKDNRFDAYYLSIYGEKGRSILSKMYNNSKIHLERKYKQYQLLINKSL